MLSTPNCSTSSLIKHLRGIHKIDNLKKSSNGCVGTGRVIQKLTTARKKHLDRFALEAIVHDARSFNDFHKSGLKRFFQYAIPGKTNHFVSVPKSFNVIMVFLY